jgi:hypothetical protein
MIEKTLLRCPDIFFKKKVNQTIFVFALSCFCSGSAWAPCRWFLLLGHVGVAFVERRLSLLILFIMFLT